MGMNEQHFTKASALLEQRRSDNLSIENKRHDEVCSKLPEYSQLENMLAQTSHKLISIMLGDAENAPQKLEELEKNNLDIQQRMKRLLTANGFSENYLDPIYTCPQCPDKGTFNGNWCECFNRLMLNVAASELNEVSPLKASGFDGFRLDVYPDEPDPNINASPRGVMKRNLDFCRNYAENFTTESNGILMCGGTGLGKTHLSLAIADVVIKKGHSVVYGSAPELLRTMEREYYGRSDDDTMSALTRCDLLILDDLGAEMAKPVYNSLLYELINARICRRLPLIVSTNLSGDELKERYQDRIWSRLFSMEALLFIGRDVRITMKNKRS